MERSRTPPPLCPSLLSPPRRSFLSSSSSAHPPALPCALQGRPNPRAPQFGSCRIRNPQRCPIPPAPCPPPGAPLVPPLSPTPSPFSRGFAAPNSGSAPEPGVPFPSPIPRIPPGALGAEEVNPCPGARKARSFMGFLIKSDPILGPAPAPGAPGAPGTERSRRRRRRDHGAPGPRRSSGPALG